MKKTMILLCFMISAVYSGIFEHGRNEIGGGFSLAYSGSGGTHGNTSLIISPFYNFYFTKSFSIGPIVSIIGPDETALGLGLRIGFGGQIKNTYLYLSPGIEWGRSGNDHAIAMPLSAGIKIFLTDHFGIDPTIAFVPVIEDSAFEYFNAGIAIAFFGLL